MKIERLEPSRLNDRKEMADPTIVESTMLKLKADPNRTKPKIDNDEPPLAKLRSDNAEPSWQVSKIESEAPRRTKDRKYNEEPIIAKSRTDKEEPKVLRS